MSFTHNINNQSSIGNPSSWSRVQDNLFEEAIVVFPKETQDKWERIATQVLGKLPLEVRQYYEDLVHDLLEIDSMGQGSEYSEGPVDFGSKAKETQRRRGVPWTEEEHEYKILIGFFCIGGDVGFDLGCTDAAKWPPHPRLTRPDAATRGGRRCLCVELRPVFFFFSFLDSCRLVPIRLRRVPTRAELGRFAPIRIVLAEYRCVSAGKRKSAGEKKKNLLKSENTSGFDAPLSPSSLALTPFFFFFFFFASSPSSSFILASPAFQFLLFL